MLHETESKTIHKEKIAEKLPQSIESFRFVSHRVKMSEEFDSRKDSQSTKFE